jgi:hypothetical protein
VATHGLGIAGFASNADSRIGARRGERLYNHH